MFFSRSRISGLAFFISEHTVDTYILVLVQFIVIPSNRMLRTLSVRKIERDFGKISLNALFTIPKVCGTVLSTTLMTPCKKFLVNKYFGACVRLQ